MTAIERMNAYRKRLIAAGRTLEARAVEECIRLTRETARQKQ